MVSIPGCSLGLRLCDQASWKLMHMNHPAILLKCWNKFSVGSRAKMWCFSWWWSETDLGALLIQEQWGLGGRSWDAEGVKVAEGWGICWDPGTGRWGLAEKGPGVVVSITPGAHPSHCFFSSWHWRGCPLYRRCPPWLPCTVLQPGVWPSLCPLSITPCRKPF